MNTHSREADCRQALFCAHAAVCGADTALCRALMEQPTADACLELLERDGLRAAVAESLLSAIQAQLDRRCGEALRAGALLFSNRFGLLGMTGTAAALLEEWKD